MRFIYLYDVEQFGQKCNIVYYNNATTGEFMICCPKCLRNILLNLNRGH